MCGRFVQTPITSGPVLPWAELAGPLAALPARYNLAPTQTAGVVVADHDRAALVALRWSLVPHWASGPTRYKLINARLESVADKPAYRDAWRRMRCVVPMAGYYEWLAGADGKVPHFLSRDDDAPLFAAGVWSHGGEDGAVQGSFAIITRAAEGLARTVHERMPAFMPAAQVSDFLAADGSHAMQLLDAQAPLPLQAWPVSTRVNSPRHDAPELLERAAGG